MVTEPGRFAWTRSWLALVTLFFVPLACWSLANPLLAVPDEPAHATKAASVWYGQLEGHNPRPGTGLRDYRLPAQWALQIPCFAFHPGSNPHDCAPNFSGKTQVTTVGSASGAYPPLYFVLVGWPARWLANDTGLYLMRLTSALLCALFLAAAVRALQQVMAPGRAVAAVLVAVPPMVMFLSGAINPNGFEICTGIALWAHLLALGRAAEVDVDHLPRNLLVGSLVSGTAMAFTRPLSGPFAGLIVVLALASLGWSTLRSMARVRSLQVAFGALVALCVVALALSLGTGLFGGLANGSVIGGSDFPAGSNHWVFLLGSTPTYIQQMLGTFGWLDTPASNLVVYGWLGLLFALGGCSLLLTKLRENLALALTVVATIALPVLLQAPVHGSGSLVWQGRYLLPIACGVPLLAMMGVDRGLSRLPDPADGPMPAGPPADPVAAVQQGGRSLSVVLAASAGLLSAWALYWNLHRYVLGFSDRGLDILHGRWEPPGGALPWLLLMLAAAAAGVAVVALAPPRAPLAGGPPDQLAGSASDSVRLGEPAGPVTTAPAS